MVLVADDGGASMSNYGEQDCTALSAARDKRQETAYEDRT